MPQFDFYSFSSQNFWVLLSFLVLYFFILYFYLANFSETIKIRQKLINMYNADSTKSKTNELSFINSFIL